MLNLSKIPAFGVKINFELLCTGLIRWVDVNFVVQVLGLRVIIIFVKRIGS